MRNRSSAIIIFEEPLRNYRNLECDDDDASDGWSESSGSAASTVQSRPIEKRHEETTNPKHVEIIADLGLTCNRQQLADSPGSRRQVVPQELVLDNDSMPSLLTFGRTSSTDPQSNPPRASSSAKPQVSVSESFGRSHHGLDKITSDSCGESERPETALKPVATALNNGAIGNGAFAPSACSVRNRWMDFVDSHPEFGLDEPRCSGFPPEHLEMVKEDFVEEIERNTYTVNFHTAYMPTLFNPIRQYAPPKTWQFLRHPSPTERDWIIQRELGSISLRSRSVCDRYKRHFFLESKHCLECRRDTLGKSFLAWRARLAFSKNQFPLHPPRPSDKPKLVHSGSHAHAGSQAVGMPPGPQVLYSSRFADSHDVSSSPRPTFSRVVSFRDSEKGDNYDGPFKDAVTGSPEKVKAGDSIGKYLLNGEKGSILKSEFEYDYYSLRPPRSPYLKDLDDFSDDSDDDSMDWDCPASPGGVMEY